MPAALSLISLNIEFDRHLEAVTAFLTEKKPDIVCLQELREENVVQFEAALGYKSFFVPMTIDAADSGDKVRGIGIFSRYPLEKCEAEYYSGSVGRLVTFDKSTPEAMERTENFVLALCTVEKEGVQYCVGTTHFTWSPDGEANEYQRRDVQKLLELLRAQGELVFCGDFNAPRGGEIFSALAARYKDNIPEKYTTSIDGTIHRAGPLELMVDGLFSTKGYECSNVELVCGLSDHCAITATIARR